MDGKQYKGKKMRVFGYYSVEWGFRMTLGMGKNGF
jgi:hypothetical protein